MAKNISLNPDIRFIFHTNNTSENFVASDQPVFNILNDIFDEKGEVKDLELYYPLSPQHALSIHFRKEQGEKFFNNKVTKADIAYYNNKVIKNADFFVFAKTKEQLEQLRA